MSPSKQAQTKKTDITERIWTFFASLRLVIFLLLILSIFSIIGTVIEQNKPLHEYYRVFKPDTVALFNKLGLFDMYHSWWFVSCLALLALNIIACTMDRYRPIVAGLKKKNLMLDEALERTLNPLAKAKQALPMETVEKNILELAGRNFTGKPIVTQAEDGGRHYFFEKGRYSRLAFFFTHLSILIIFIGALVGSFFGYKGYINVFEGEGVSQLETRAQQMKKLGFTVKCDSFNVDFYPNGMPKDYRSDLVVIKEGREIIKKTIRVNDPLTFEGVTFYQSSYGTQPERAVIQVMDKDGAEKGTVTAPFGQKIPVPGIQDTIELAAYQDQFRMPDGADGGMALGINIYPADGTPIGIWLPEKDPEYDKMRQGNYYLRVKTMELKKYTGLQVNKDPGEWVVWIGSILFTAGIMIAFFVSHKRFWICLKRDKKGRIDVTAGGTTNKNRSAFVKETEGIIQGIKEMV